VLNERAAINAVALTECPGVYRSSIELKSHEKTLPATLPAAMRAWRKQKRLLSVSSSHFSHAIRSYKVRPMDLLLWLLIGILGGNAVPHLVKGITKEYYPCALGNGPVPNFIGGWLRFVLALGLARLALNSRVSDLDLIAGSIGFLLIGLFHAWIGAFGRK
jgi:hypothetical protein